MRLNPFTERGFLDSGIIYFVSQIRLSFRVWNWGRAAAKHLLWWTLYYGIDIFWCLWNVGQANGTVLCIKWACVLLDTHTRWRPLLFDITCGSTHHSTPFPLAFRSFLILGLRCFWWWKLVEPFVDAWFPSLVLFRFIKLACDFSSPFHNKCHIYNWC